MIFWLVIIIICSSHILRVRYFKNHFISLLLPIYITFITAGNLKAACQAAASYLLFYPDDDTMRSNLKYYKKLPKVEASYFTPRPVRPQRLYVTRCLLRVMKYQPNDFIPYLQFLCLLNLIFNIRATSLLKLKFQAFTNL